MPSTPENGARIVLRSIVARISPTCASACLCSAAAASNSARETASLLDQALHALEVQRARSRCASAAASCACSCRVSSCDQHVALLDRLARLEGDPVDDAGQVGADGHALHGRDRADRVERRRPLLALRDDRRHRLRRRLHRGELLRHGLELPELHEAERRDEGDHHDHHQNHSLRHCLSSFVAVTCRSCVAVVAVTDCDHPPPSARYSCTIDAQLLLPEPREIELALKEIPLRIEHRQVAVESALVALGGQL